MENCPECGSPMKNLGNVENIVMACYPAAWYETHICEKCKIKKKVCVHDEIPQMLDLSGYREV